jgi:hypothetical protein
MEGMNRAVVVVWSSLWSMRWNFWEQFTMLAPTYFVACVGYHNNVAWCSQVYFSFQMMIEKKNMATIRLQDSVLHNSASIPVLRSLHLS